MGRLLKLALEGEQVEIVEGMFIAVPLSAQEDMLALSTESLGEKVEGVARAIWAKIAKLIAAVLATIKGVAKWLFNKVKGDRGRKINKEIVHQYEVMEETIRGFKDADPDSRMESVAKADGLDKQYSAKLSATAHALLDDPKAYLGTVAAVEKMLDTGNQSEVVKASAMLVALAKLGPSHPLQDDDTQNVQKQIDSVHAQFESLPEKLQTIHDLIAVAYKNKGTDRLPANPDKLAAVLAAMAQTLSGSATVETFMRWEKEIELIEKDLELAQRHTQATERASTDEALRTKAKTMLDGYAAFWKELQPILKALAMLDQLRSGVFQLTDTVIDFWKAVVKRTMDEYKDRETVLDRIVELDRRFKMDAAKLKHMRGAGGPRD